MSWFLCLPLREFSREKLCCFYIQPPCCHALTGTYKKKLRSLSDISFMGKTLDGSYILVRTKSCLFPCAWAISPCIFKLRTVRFEPFFRTCTVTWRLNEEQENHPEQNCRAASSSLLGCLLTASKQVHSSVKTVVMEQVFPSHATFGCFQPYDNSHCWEGMD